MLLPPSNHSMSLESNKIILNLKKIVQVIKSKIFLADTTSQLHLLLREENDVILHRRVRRSLVSECCNASCTDEVIRDKYCKAADPEEI